MSLRQTDLRSILPHCVLQTKAAWGSLKSDVKASHLRLSVLLPVLPRVCLDILPCPHGLNTLTWLKADPACTHLCTVLCNGTLGHNISRATAEAPPVHMLDLMMQDVCVRGFEDTWVLKKKPSWGRDPGPHACRPSSVQG